MWGCSEKKQIASYFGIVILSLSDNGYIFLSLLMSQLLTSAISSSSSFLGSSTGTKTQLLAVSRVQSLDTLSPQKFAILNTL